MSCFRFLCGKRTNEDTEQQQHVAAEDLVDETTDRHQASDALQPLPRSASRRFSVSIESRLADYIEGDDDDQSIQSLLQMPSSSGISTKECHRNLVDSTIVEEGEFGDSDPEDEGHGESAEPGESAKTPMIKHQFVIALPRTPWADRVLQDTPRSTSPSTPSSSSTADPFEGSASGEPSSSQDPQSREHEYYLMNVARNLMTFNLGVHPNKNTNESFIRNHTTPTPRRKNLVKKAMQGVNNFDSDDLECAFQMIKVDIMRWIEKKAKRRSRRSTISGHIVIGATECVSETIERELEHSPKGLLSSDERDEEVRTFVGETEDGIPLIRLNVLRCCEKSPRTLAHLITGLIVISVDVADQFQAVSKLYIKFILEYLVDNAINVFDFVRISTYFAKKYEISVFFDLVRRGVFNSYNDRIIKYARGMAPSRPPSVMQSRRSSFVACDKPSSLLKSASAPVLTLSSNSSSTTSSVSAEDDDDDDAALYQPLPQIPDFYDYGSLQMILD